MSEAETRGALASAPSVGLTREIFNIFSNFIFGMCLCPVKSRSHSSLIGIPFSESGPSIDGVIITDSPAALIANGSFLRVPFISGNNKDEWVEFPSLAVRNYPKCTG